MYILGFDIGGTKCAVVTALWDGKTMLVGAVTHVLIANPTEGYGYSYSLRASPLCGGASRFAPFSERSRSNLRSLADKQACRLGFA